LRRRNGVRSDNAEGIMKKTVPAVIGILLSGCAARPDTGPDRADAGLNSYVQAARSLDGGDTRSAIDGLRAAIDANPTLRMARIRLAEMLMAQKDFDAALPHLSAAVELDPYSIDNHYRLGLSYQMLQRLREAAAAYERGLSIDPADVRCHVNLSIVKLALDEPVVALRHAVRAAGLAPQSHAAVGNLGVVQDANRLHTQAERSLRQAIELSPDSTSHVHNLVANLIAQQKHDEAVQAATRLVSMDGTAMSYKRLGDACSAAERWAEAELAYDAALSGDASFIPALNGKSIMFMRRYRATAEVDAKLLEQSHQFARQSLSLNRDQPAMQKLLESTSPSKQD
jgi:tetratricopeptide (TPR) repeat protein